MIKHCPNLFWWQRKNDRSSSEPNNDSRHRLLAKLTYRYRLKQPPKANLCECHRCSELQRPCQHSSHHHQSLQQQRVSHLGRERREPYQSLQKYWLKSVQCQKCRIHFQNGAGILRCHRTASKCPCVHDDLSKFYAGNFDDPHPKSNGHRVFEIHNAKPLLTQLCPN